MTMQEASNILVFESNGIVTVTLNRPLKRNALHGPMIVELLNIIKKISTDNHARILIIKGNGEHFCAGADIDWMQKIASGSDHENYQDAQLLSDLLYQLYFFPKPSIVLAHGATLGGGLGLLSACDIAIAAKNARFRFSEVTMGIAPSVISPYVIRAMGERAAVFYFLSGESFDVNEAQRLGLIHQYVENEALTSTGMVLANTFLKNSSHALIAAKQIIRRVAGEKITASLMHMTAEHLANLRAAPHAQEGLKAFLEKRKPNWS